IPPSFSINPKVIKVNMPVTFTDLTKGATEWHWAVRETGENLSSESFTTTLNKVGNNTIHLIVKGKNIIGDTTFTIDAKPGGDGCVVRYIYNPNPVHVNEDVTFTGLT